MNRKAEKKLSMIAANLYHVCDTLDEIEAVVETTRRFLDEIASEVRFLRLELDEEKEEAE